MLELKSVFGFRTSQMPFVFFSAHRAQPKGAAAHDVGTRDGWWSEAAYVPFRFTPFIFFPLCSDPSSGIIHSVKERIVGVTSVRKITKAMQLIASSKMKATERRMLSARIFAVCIGLTIVLTRLLIRTLIHFVSFFAVSHSRCKTDFDRTLTSMLYISMLLSVVVCACATLRAE